MATAVKFEVITEHLANAVHDLFGTDHTLKIVIHTDAPVAATDTILANLTQITGTGYTSGGEDVQNNGTRSGGTLTVTGTDVVWTAGASDWSASARYVGLYNDSPTSPADPLMLDWDYGSTFALVNGETFTADFGASVLTLS
jgi:hypothetical protein